MFNFNQKYLRKAKGHIFFAGAICLLLLSTGGCYWFDDARSVMTSGIQPAPLLIPGKTKIKLTAPGYGAALTGLGASFHDFFFDSTAAKYAALYIFNQQPSIDATSSFIKNMVNICHGGATNLAGHTWNNLSLRLHWDPTKTQFYKCTSSAVDLLSQTQRLAFDNTNFTNGATYYWAVLGYDENYLLTHSSEVRSFTVP